MTFQEFIASIGFKSGISFWGGAADKIAVNALKNLSTLEYEIVS